MGDVWVMCCTDVVEGTDRVVMRRAWSNGGESWWGWGRVREVSVVKVSGVTSGVERM